MGRLKSEHPECTAGTDCHEVAIKFSPPAALPWALRPTMPEVVALPAAWPVRPTMKAKTEYANVSV